MEGVCEIVNDVLVDEVKEKLKDMELQELKARSDKWDSKILEKRKREDLEEEDNARRKENNKDREENINTKNNSNKRPKDSTEDTRSKHKKFDKIYENKTEKVNEKSNIIEPKYWDLVGEYRIKVDATSDGTCQADAKLAALIGMKDPEGKIELAKAENKYLLDNFELYKDSFAYPHMIKIGL